MKTTAPIEEVYRVIHNDHHDPFRVLGAHTTVTNGATVVVVRSFLPLAQTVTVVASEAEGGAEEYVMEKVHEDGFFEVVIPNRTTVFPYQLRMTTKEGKTEQFHDSYSFMPTLTDFDIYLFNAGDNHRIYEKLGAHHMEVSGVGGVQFAVWHLLRGV